MYYNIIYNITITDYFFLLFLYFLYSISSMKDELNKINKSVLQKGPIDLETFQTFTKFHQAIVYRSFNVQMKLRNTILAVSYTHLTLPTICSV